jgi:hypothetical protein
MSGFELYCAETGRRSLPAAPETVLAYLERRVVEDTKASTLHWIVAAIGRAHEGAGLTPPASRALRTLLRMHGRIDKEEPIGREALSDLLGACGTNLRGLRDRALFLVMHHARLSARRVVTLDVPDLAEWPELEPVRRPLAGDPLCPVAALGAWLAARSRPVEGPPFIAVYPRDREPFGARLQPTDVHRALERVTATAGLPRVTPACLRRPRDAGVPLA